MKTSEAKITSTAFHLQKKENQPFFTKDGEGSFFSKSNKLPQSFFGQSIIQPKLTIGQPNDKYEQEADAMADKVVQRLSDKSFSGSENNPAHFFNKHSSFVQRKCATCEREEKLQKKDKEDEKGLLKNRLQKKAIFESNAEPPDDEKNIRRKCAECEWEDEKKIQTKPDNFLPQNDSPNIESNLNSSRSSGVPLPAATREQMEHSFGADFSGVRIHTDNSAVKMNKTLNAQAFTNGNDIYFNSGKYDLEGEKGKQLLAHELTHTIQQASPNQVRRDGNETEVDVVDPVYENLRNYFKNEDLQNAIVIVTNMTAEQKDFVLSSSEFKELATRSSTGGADFGDESITQLMEAFLSNGYQNLYWCLNWMFYEFDADEDNDERFLRILRRHNSESQKKFVRAWMKDQFIEYVGDQGMAGIVKLLGGPLYEKLLWIKDEGVDSWDLAYGVIIDHLSKQSIAKEDSYAIFNNPLGKADMRWYFGRKIDVGDYTMVRVVNLFGFELYQKLDWMIYEDTNLALVLNVIGSSPQTEIKHVLESNWLLIKLQQSIGESDYGKAVSAMKNAAGLVEKRGESLNISILDSTIKEEIEPGVVSESESYERLFTHGMFLLESARDQYKIVENNSAIAEGFKQWWKYHIDYLEALLKLHQEFKDEEKKAEGAAESETETLASNTPKRDSGKVQATFIQAQWWVPLAEAGGKLTRGGVRFVRATIRLSGPKLGVPELPRPTIFPQGSGAFPAASGSTAGTLARIMGIARGALRYPVPPVSPIPQTEPISEPKDSFSRSEWKEETGRKLNEMRRQIEEMKTSRNAQPTTETEPGKDQESEQEKRKRKVCYRLSIVLRRAGSGFVTENMGAMTPDDLRIPACRERTLTGTTDFDFMLRNIAVGRFLVDGTYRTIATPNPEGNYHSEDEMFRLANEQFGIGNYTLDALFTERRPCQRCAPMITRFPLTNTFRVYCIINNDYNWTQIRAHYNNGELF